MFAANTMQVDHRAIGDMVADFKNSFDEVYIELIKDGKVESGAADYLIFIEKISMSMFWLVTPPTLPESIEMIRGGVSLLDRLLKKQSIIDSELVATGLQTLAEMEKLVGVGGQMVYLNKEQVKQLDQLVQQFLQFSMSVFESIPPTLADSLRRAMSVAEKNSTSDSSSEQTDHIIEPYQAIESYVYMTLIDGANPVLATQEEVEMRLEQDLGRELLDTIIAGINISHEHLVMSLNFLAGDLSNQDFVGEYRQFLHRYADFFSTEQIQGAEQKLVNLL